MDLSGQSTFILNGNVKDKQTGESMIRAAIRIDELPSLGVLSNEYGFYAIALPRENTPSALHSLVMKNTFKRFSSIQI